MCKYPGACSDNLAFTFAERKPGSVTFAEHKSESITFPRTNGRTDTRPNAQTLAGAFTVTEIEAEAANLAFTCCQPSRRWLSASEIAFSSAIGHHACFLYRAGIKQ
jgi:hypothetical protein